jgi:pantetheine-phosphate adenylyltransferase
MPNIAIFPGSFDPITRGHENVILRALPLFDKIIVAVGQNAEKKSHFSMNQRVGFLKKVFSNYPAVEIDQYSGLTVEYCRAKGARYILRGLRTSADFEFERTIGQVNKKLYPDIETVFLLTMPEFTAINSSVVREILKYGGDVSQFIPEGLNLSEV